MKVIKAFLFLLVSLLCVPLFGQMSGTYTIDSSSNAPNNFNSIAKALDSLKLVGNSGPVIFEFAKGDYYNPGNTLEISTLKGSAGNEITIQPNPAAKDSVNLHFNLTLTDCEYINISDLNFFNLQSEKLNSIVLKKSSNISIDGNSISSQFRNTLNIGIKSILSQNVSIINNDIQFVDSGIVVLDSINLLSSNKVNIKSNSIDEFTSLALYLEKGNEISLSTNKIGNSTNANTTSCIQIHTYGQLIITKNQIKTNANFGIYISNKSNKSDISISNNYLYSNSKKSSSLLYLDNVNDALIYHNTIWSKSEQQNLDTAIVTFKSSSNNDFTNNIVYSDSSVNLFFEDQFVFSKCNFNIYYSNYNKYIVGSKNSHSIVSNQFYYGYDLNSIFTNPGFISKEFPRIKNPICKSKGIHLKSIDTDIHNLKRDSSYVEIGAIGNSLFKTDVGIALELGTSCSDSVELILKLYNNGTDTLKTARIEILIEDDKKNNVIVSNQWTGTLLATENETLNLGKIKLEKAAFHIFTGIVSNPNNLFDSLPENNKSTQFYNISPLFGEYTIGKSNCDFRTIQEAFNEINKNGTCSNVTLLIKDQFPEYGGFLNYYGIDSIVIKPYQGLAFTPEFKVGNLEYFRLTSGHSLSFYDLVFNDEQYTGALYDLFETYSELKNLNFNNCEFKSSAQNRIVLGDQRRAYNNYHYKFANCQFTNFYKAVQLTRNNSRFGTLEILNCNFSNVHLTIDVDNIVDVVFSNNSIQGNGNGIKIDYVTLAQIDHNRIELDQGSNLFFEISSTTITNIYNNYLANGHLETLSSSADIGFKIDGHTINVKHNTIEFKSKIGSNECAQINGYNIEHYNNVYVNSVPNKLFSFQGTANNLLSDNNCYSGLGVNYLGTPLGTASTLPAFTALINTDSNSIETNPELSYGFITDSASMDKGKPIGFITDINGEIRDSLKPDIGAFESELLGTDLELRNLFIDNKCVSNDTLFAVIKNTGNQSVSNYTIKWKSDHNSNWKFKTVQKLLNKKNTDTVFLESYVGNDVRDGISCKIDSSNNLPESFVNNDSLYLTGYLRMSGEYTISATNSTADFNSVKAFFSAVNRAVVCDTIIGTVSDTSEFFNERISVNMSSNGVLILRSDINKRATIKLSKSLIDFYNHGNFILENIDVFYDADINSSVFNLYGGIKSINFRNVSLKGTGKLFFIDYYATIDELKLDSCNIDMLSNHYLITKENNFLNNPRISKKIFLTNNSIRSNFKVSSITHFDSTIITKNEIYCSPGDSETFYIEPNKFIDFSSNKLFIEGKTGVLVHGKSTDSVGFVRNNILHITTKNSTNLHPYAGTLLEIKNTKNYKIIHNTLVVEGDPFPKITLLNFDSDYGIISNNIFQNRKLNNSNWYSFIRYRTYSIYSDYNSYYSAGSNPSFFSNHKLYSSLDSNSILGDVLLSNNDYSPKTIRLNNKGNALYSTLSDIDGDLRGTSPDIGAQEFTTNSLDVKLDSIFANGICGDTTFVSLKVSNVGSNALTSLKAFYSLDSGKNYTDSIILTSILLNPGHDTIISFTKKVRAPYIEFNIAAKVNSPNGLIDGDTSDNYLLRTTHFGIPASGNFQVGQNSTGKFKDFSKLCKYLSNYGVCGPVSVELLDSIGVYVGILNDIEGASATNSITIFSNFFNSSFFSKEFYLEIISTPHVTLKKIKARNNSMLLYAANSSPLLIDSCNFQMVDSNGELLFDNNMMSIGGATQIGDSSKISNTIFEGGLTQLGVNGSALSLLEVENCQFLKNKRNAISAYSMGGISIVNNQILGLADNASYSKIKINRTNYFKIDKNHIKLGNNETGNAIEIENSNKRNQSIISNNFIRNYGGGSSIYLYQSDSIQIINNTMYDAGDVSIYAFLINMFRSDSVILENNIGICKNPNKILTSYYSSFRSSNNNIWNTTHLLPFKILNTHYSFSDWQSVFSHGASSSISSINLLNNLKPDLYSQESDSNAISNSLIDKDIYGNLRNATHPDIGAFEFDLSQPILKIKSVYTDSNCATPLTVWLDLKNEAGYDSIKTIDLTADYLFINGTKTSRSYSFSGLNLDVDSAMSLLLDTISIGGFSNFELALKIDSINGQPSLQLDTVDKIVNAPLSGSYLIGSDSLTDFKSISQATQALKNYGVCSNVTFVLKDLLYNEEVVIDSINYLNSNIGVTFISDPVLSSISIIRSALPLKVSNAKNLSFRKIKFENVLNILHDTVVQLSGRINSLSIDSCVFESNNSMSGSPAGITAYCTQSDSISITNCEFYNAEVAALLGGKSNSNQINGFIFNYNTVSNAPKGLHLNYTDSIEIIGNNFDLTNDTQFHYPNGYPYAIRGINLYRTGAFTIKKNQINFKKSTSTIGIEISYNLNQFVQNEISNNMISNTSSIGINLLQATSINLLFNSITTNYSNNSVANQGVGLALGGCSQLLINNNIINAYKYGIWYKYFSEANKSHIGPDYNMIHGKQGTILVGSSGYDLNQFRLYFPSKEVHSQENEIVFYGTNNLHTTDYKIDGAGKHISNVVTDFDNNSRSNPPDVGADEIEPMNYDLQVVDIGYISSCARTDTSTVTVQNAGKTTINSFNVYLQVFDSTNNILQFDTIIYSGNLLSLDSVTVSSKVTLSNPVKYVIKARTELLGAHNDSNQLNNSLQKEITNPMGGIYTVVPDSGDFLTFYQAITHLKKVGICGPTTILTYNEPNLEGVTLTNIPGTSNNNNLTFKSLFKNSPTTIHSNWTHSLELNSVKHVTINNYVFSLDSNNNSSAVIFKDTCKDVNLINCQFITDTTWGRFGIRNLYGYLDNITISGCEITGFKTGVFHYPFQGILKNLHIINNDINSETAVSLEDVSGLTITNNKLTGNSTALYIDNCKDFRISENNISANYPLNILNCFDPIFTERLINNNFFSGDECVLIKDCKRLSLLHNNFLSTNNSALRYDSRNLFSVDSIILINNCMEFNNAFPYRGSGSFDRLTNETIDYNNYYGSKYNHSAPATGNNSHSTSLNPLYFATNDLHIINDSLNGKGSFVGIYTDIDGELRDTVMPTIGADEKLLFNRDLSALGILDNKICEDSLSLAFITLNVGDSTINNFELVWLLDSGSGFHIMDTLNVNKTLNKRDTALTYVPSRYYTRNNTYRIKYYSQHPNSLADMNLKNDTSESTLLFTSYQKESFTIPDSLCQSVEVLNLSGTSTNATFLSPAINNKYYPRTRNSGLDTITYRYFQNSYCYTDTSQTITILSSVLTSIPNYGQFCQYDSAFVAKGYTPSWGKLVSTSLINDSIIDPGQLIYGPHSIGIYSIDSISGCKDSSYSAFFINSVTSVTLPQKDICDYDVIQKLNWGTPSGGIYKGAGVLNGNDFNTSLVTLGQHQLIYEYTNALGCVSSDTSFINVKEVPQRKFISKDTTYCEFDNFKPMNVLNPDSGVTYKWYNLTSGFNYIGAGNSKIPSSIIGTTKYFFRPELNGCKAGRSDTNNITIKQAPTITSNSILRICQGDALNSIQAQSSLGGAIKWYNINDTSTILHTGNNFKLPFNTGDYSYNTQTEQAGCKSALTRVSGSVDSTIIADLGPDQYLCKGAVTLSSSNFADGYLWNDGLGNKTRQVTEPGTFTLRLEHIGKYKTCYSTDTINVGICNGINWNSGYEDQLVVFPNPIIKGSHFYLNNVGNKACNWDIEIIDSQGKTVYSNSKLLIEKSIKIDVLNWSSGTYFIECKNEYNFIFSDKIIIN